MNHHRFWVDCPYCEGQYRQGEEHGPRDCIHEVISAHRFALQDQDDFADTADQIVDALTKRGNRLT